MTNMVVDLCTGRWLTGTKKQRSFTDSLEATSAKEAFGSDLTKIISFYKHRTREIVFDFIDSGYCL